MSLKSQTLNLSFVLLVLVLSSGIAFPNSQEDWQQSLLARLASGGEEQRFDAAAQLVVLFSAAPGSATEQTLNALATALRRDNSPLVRALSARALEICCGEQAVPLLLAGLTDEREVAVRKAILYALAAHRSPQITPALIPYLNDKKQETRAAAAYALAEIADAGSAISLLEVLQKRRGDEDVFARGQAARGLGKIGSRAAMNILLDSLSRDKFPEVRRESARALGLISSKQDTKVVESLRNLTLQSDPYLSVIAEDALERIRLRNP